MPTFYSFAEGVNIPDGWINDRLADLKRKLLTGCEHWDCSTGDTMLSAHVYDGFIGISVATSAGYASIKFESFDELRAWTPNFSRSMLTKSAPMCEREAYRLLPMLVKQIHYETSPEVDFGSLDRMSRLCEIYADAAAVCRGERRHTEDRAELIAELKEKHGQVLN